ncbi:MAG: trypsin-like peptidase domain-containing protein [Pirellulales bacterium]
MRPAIDTSPGGWMRYIAPAAAIAILGFVGMPPGTAQEPTAATAAAALEQTLVDAIEKAGKSVVAIARVDPWEAPRHGDRVQLRRSTPADADFVPDHFGTGVVIDRGGFILTQYHVVSEKSEHYVTTSDGKIYSARIHGADPRSDLAILRIISDSTPNLTAIRFGDASKLKRGQIVIALGNPYAIARDGQASASWGIVANVSRKVPPGTSEGAGSAKDKLYHFGTLIQTDAKLNLGTSGGALLNLKGEMIGLTTSLAATAGYEQAAGYAIPVDEVFVRAVETMKRGDEVEYGFLGVVPETLALGDQSKGTVGVRVSTVVPGTPADRSDLQTGDIITHVNERPIPDADSLILQVGRKPVESLVRLTVLRESRPQSIEVKLTKFPVRGTKIVASPPPSWRGLRVDYPTASMEELQNVRNTESELLRRGGVLITEVQRDSPAWEAKLQPGMFIADVSGQKVTSPREFRTAILGKNGSIELKIFGGDLIKGPETRVIRSSAR